MEDRSIVAEGITRRFGEQVAVDHVDLDVPSGQIFAFLGPNGAGKSTFVKIVTTILAATEGSARVAGFDVGREGHEVRLRIGVALQDVGVDPLMTAGEMLMLQSMLFGTSLSEARPKATLLLKTVGLEDVPAKKRVGQYSGGMKRRLDLALALVHDPKILFLDEPTSGLDPVSRTAIWEEVRRLNVEQGMTIFLTTQYLEEADRLAQEVAIIDRGKIVARGTPDRLKREMGNDVITVSFDSAETARKAAEALGGMCRGMRVSNAELSCYADNAAALVPALVRKLDEAHLNAAGLTLSRPTLDDVFLKATGARLAVTTEGNRT